MKPARALLLRVLAQTALLFLCSTRALAQPLQDPSSEQVSDAGSGELDSVEADADGAVELASPGQPIVTDNDTEASALTAPEVAHPPAGALQVTVETKRDEVRALRASSAAVKVVDTRQLQGESGDLGAVLSRQEGVNVQRAGGLGSQARISVQGLGADQLRFYVDGIPLALTGLPENLANVPIDLISRAEIYRGVVPARLGGDTVGGAIQLVSEPITPNFHGRAALTLGSFDTQRAALRAQWLDPRSKLYGMASGFLDHARNDYRVEVDGYDAQGRAERQPAYRRHDGYRGGFGQLELGVVDQPYAKRLAVRGFLSGYDKEINHDVVMTTPYGEVLSRRRAQGAVVLYEQDFPHRLQLNVKAGYTRRTPQLRDLGACSYDWNGQCVSARPNGGEIGDLPTNRHTREHALFARAQLALRASRYLQLRLSAAPTYSQRDARDKAVAAGMLDTFAGERQLFSLVTGLEHELDALAGRLENVLFAKHYVQRVNAEAQAIQGPYTVDRTHQFVGAGNALRVRLSDALVGKLSYELGTRLPDAEELFGDGVLVIANYGLKPEKSHNLNLELQASHATVSAGTFEASCAGFFRRAERLIVLLPGPALAQYFNVDGARIGGAEAAARYISPHSYLTVDGNVTWQEMRNASSKGSFGRYKGHRIPNRPYFFANLGVTGRLERVANGSDALSLTFREHWVASFLRNWDMPTKGQLRVPAQLVSSLLLTYEVREQARAVAVSIEAHNLTDSKVYDFFGVQRPGRYLMAKLSLEM